MKKNPYTVLIIFCIIILVIIVSWIYYIKFTFHQIDHEYQKKDDQNSANVSSAFDDLKREFREVLDESGKLSDEFSEEIEKNQELKAIDEEATKQDTQD